ncbi:MAG: phosphatidylserine decarboxylase, partial [Alphaproteobacteria bacterium]
MKPPILVPIHREGWPFVAAFAVVAAGLALLWQPLGWIGLIATAWCTYFFRDPARVVPDRAGLVVSPADGVVQLVEPGVPPAELGMGELPRPRVSIFMDVFDVHINRMPVAATVTRTAYRPGKFMNASLDKASSDNERMGLVLRMDDGRDLAVVQIAGLVARRIKCWVGTGERLAAGERFGMIRFGSRVDVYLPDGTAPL